MTITEARQHIGQGVVYRPHDDAPVVENGTIVRVNDTWVFVLYSGDTTPKATSPHNLELLARAA